MDTRNVVTDVVSGGMVRFTCECGTRVAVEAPEAGDVVERCSRCRRRQARRDVNQALVRA